MHILLGNNTLSLLAGSETYMLTLAKQLVKDGHDVTAYSPNLGFIATIMEGLGIKCINELEGDKKSQIKPFSPILEEVKGDFDLAICAHHDITQDIRKNYPNIPIIAIVHGILHKANNGDILPEHPVVGLKNCQYIAVSEEIQDKLKKDYGIESKIIHNFFDLEIFKPGPKPKEIKSILLNSNYYGIDSNLTEFVKQIGEHYNAEIMAIGANFKTSFDIQEVIKKADVVFGMGRSVMEGVCMGKIGVVHGRWGVPCVINEHTYPMLVKSNFSGRNQDLFPEGVNVLEKIIQDIDAALKDDNHEKIMGKFVKGYHDVEAAAHELLKIANDLI